jgi:hypothetical protein
LDTSDTPKSQQAKTQFGFVRHNDTTDEPMGENINYGGFNSYSFTHKTYISSGLNLVKKKQRDWSTESDIKIKLDIQLFVLVFSTK